MQTRSFECFILISSHNNFLPILLILDLSILYIAILEVSLQYVIVDHYVAIISLRVLLHPIGDILQVDLFVPGVNSQVGESFTVEEQSLPVDVGFLIDKNYLRNILDIGSTGIDFQCRSLYVVLISIEHGLDQFD